MIKFDGKITGLQLKKGAEKIIEQAIKDGYEPGVSQYWKVCLESLEIISNKLSIDFEINATAPEYLIWDKSYPFWGANINFMETGAIIQIDFKNYNWDMDKCFNKIAKIIKDAINCIM